MKTTICFLLGPWNGRKESIDLKEGEKVSSLDVPTKDGFYARYVCQHGHENAPRSVDVTYARLLSQEDLRSTQKRSG